MYSRKKTFEELPEAMTPVWSCTREDCNGWMRANFTFEDEPDCPKCHSAMVSEVRSLPVLVNTSRMSKFPGTNRDEPVPVLAHSDAGPGEAIPAH